MPHHSDTLKEEGDRSEYLSEASLDDVTLPDSDTLRPPAPVPDSHNSLPPVPTPERDLEIDVTPAYIEQPISVRRRHGDVLSLAWPSVATMLLQTFNGMMDTLFVGHLPNGPQALAATGVGGQIIFLLISLAMGVSVGTTALVSRFTGAREPERAVRATAQSLTLSFLLALFFGAAFYIGRRLVVHTMLGGRGSSSSEILCMQFLNIAMLGTVPLFVMNVFMAAFRGLGDTRTPLYIQLVIISTHISLNWLFIYGHLGMPRLGVAGAGLAFATSLFVGTTLYIIALNNRTTLSQALTWQHLKFRLEWAKRILKIGIPASVQAVVRTLAMMSFTGMLARTVEGSAGVAAMQIGIRAEAIAFMPGFGYSVAASALVGQSLGAKNPKRAEQYGWAATAQGVAVMTVMATLFFLLASPIASLFVQDRQVHDLGVDYLRVNAWCEPFLALGMVLTGALQGAGDTVRPTYITFFTMWIVRLPLAYWLMFVLRLETHGAWLSMTVTTVIGGLMTLFLFRSGKWKKIRV